MQFFNQQLIRAISDYHNYILDIYSIIRIDENDRLIVQRSKRETFRKMTIHSFMLQQKQRPER